MTKDKQKTCFVVSPIGSPGSVERTHADWLLQEIIAPVFTSHFADFSVVRADKISQPGMIDSQIINMLLDAELVIADMSFQNANVFYEMGIRHLKRKPIVHMFLNGGDIPFDVKPHRAIPFDLKHPDDLIAARTSLKEAVSEVIKPEYRVDNPVTRARSRLQLEESSTPETKALLSQIAALEDRLSRVESGNDVRNYRLHHGTTVSDLLNLNEPKSFLMIEFPKEMSKSEINAELARIDSRYPVVRVGLPGKSHSFLFAGNDYARIIENEGTRLSQLGARLFIDTKAHPEIKISSINFS